MKAPLLTEKFSAGPKPIFVSALSRAETLAILHKNMEMEIARPKLKQNSISSGGRGQRDLNMFAHKIVKTTVNFWAGEDSGTENYGRFWGGQDPQLQLSDIQGLGKI